VQVEQGGLTNGTTAEREETAELFARHASGIYRYCLRRLGSPEEAEDALQVTFLNAWRSLKEGCRPTARRAWLFQIAANVCASNMRSKLGGTRLELRDPGTLDELVGVEDPESEELLGLREALRELPARQRRALVLRDWRGLSYDEIATEMAVSGAAVETLLFRARTKVATTLANGEWRPKLASSARALFFWPFAFLRTKSTALTGPAHLKMGLALAGGTVLPLVTFGVIQTLLLTPQQATRPNGGSASAGVGQLEAPALWLEDARLARTEKALRREDAKLVRTEKPGRRAGSGHGSKPSVAAAHPSSSPAPAAAAQREDKIVLCHATPSNEQPGVTISVSPHALSGLGEDARGTCG
jgi:RNA polymerase sigma-70 factor, ECF subfamily